MDSAYLHNSVFNIELKRRELEQQSLDREEIIRWFEDHYRVFSRKSAFVCVCCHKPVTMNLTKDKGRPFYFRHNDESECSYSENTRTYDKHVAKLENPAKKDIGLTIFREILEGELKPYGVKVERGFHYKKKLSFIPDFIITFPHSQERWAVDYFTAIGQGLASGSYARHLSKRMKTYKEEGFKSFSFVDYSWLSFIEETNKGTLLSAETYVTSKSPEDDRWDQFLTMNLQAELLDFFMLDKEVQARGFDTRNIAYVDVHNRNCTIFRFIQIAQQDRNITFYKLSSSQIPLARALSMNDDRNHFVLSKDNEEEQRNDFLKLLIEKKYQYNLEQQRLEEEQQRMKDEQEKMKQEEEKKRELLKAEAAERAKLLQRARELEDEQIERERQERIRLANLRPVEFHPDYWNDRRGPNRYNNNSAQTKTTSAPFERIEDSIERKKNEKVRDLLLSHPIRGDLYINGDPKAWRLIILEWINENQSRDTLIVSTQKMISHLKGAGISFDQNEQLVKYPIKEFLEYYVKTLKTELKKKVELIIQ